MKRRDFFKYSISTLAIPTIINANITTIEQFVFPSNIFSSKIEPEKKIEKKIIKINEVIEKKEIIKELKIAKKIEKKKLIDIKKDLFLEKKYINAFSSVNNKLKIIQSYVGYGNFNVIGFDEIIKLSKYSSKLEAFTKSELEFFETIFYSDPKYHGFYGDRISTKITQRINKKDIKKIPRTGHYLYKGEPEKIYNRMINDIGESLTLTSGVRSIVKQTKLFLDKLNSTNGNLSIASNSLAPPAYTYHSIADFDVGKKGLGLDNFTRRFALTQEFLEMRKLKYIEMRYTINNKDGVRYEPWHVKVI